MCLLRHSMIVKFNHGCQPGFVDLSKNFPLNKKSQIFEIKIHFGTHGLSDSWEDMNAPYIIFMQVQLGIRLKIQESENLVHLCSK